VVAHQDWVLYLYVQRGSTPLHFATRRKHIPTAVLLLNAGCPLDVVDVNGETPLHLAARDGVIEIVRGMCVYGCSVDIVNKVSFVCKINNLRYSQVSICNYVVGCLQVNITSKFLTALFSWPECYISYQFATQDSVLPRWSGRTES